jgi:hypothetical protein
MNNLSSSLEFSISHMSMSFSMDESSQCEKSKVRHTRTIEQNGLLMQIILDCTSYKINQLVPYSNQDLVQIERATQHYCFMLQFEYGTSWFILYEVQSKMICISSPFCSIVRVCRTFDFSHFVICYVVFLLEQKCYRLLTRRQNQPAANT